MKIISYNVNGIRAAMKKNLLGWIKSANPDVLCIQEMKAQIDQIPIKEFEEIGYKSFWHCAQKKGYSGVGILTKTLPDQVIYGINNEQYDHEGRFIRADYGDISVVSVYHPSGTTGEVRQAFKMKWLDYFQSYINELKKNRPNLIISGDYNICHKPIDIHDPIGNAHSSGFLPEEREWIGKFIDSGFIDTFRFFNQEPHNYTWWSFRANARMQNKGWRIDYHMVSQPLEKKLKRALILPEAEHSDHCPILVEVDF